MDRNRLKGGTLNKAKKLDIPTARLNLNMDRFRFTKGTTVLTVNHVAEILLEVANGLAWDDALKKVCYFPPKAERREVWRGCSFCFGTSPFFLGGAGGVSSYS